MKSIFYKNYKAFLTSIFLFLFSLSCDDSKPVSAENPDITYSISIQTEVRNCHLLNCIDGVAYAYDVDNPLENDYHLYFELELLDSNDDPIEGAEINIQECIIAGDDTSTCEATAAQFSYFDGGTTTTSNQGILEGYWKDSGQDGSFLITFEYVDEFGTEATITNQITINSLADFINLNVWGETEELFSDNTNITYQTTISARVLNEYNSSMPNIPILFDLLTDGVGSLDNAFAYTSDTGEPASVIYTIEPATIEGLNSDNVQVEFDISVFNEDINKALDLTYSVTGGQEPEFDVAEFNFYPNDPSTPHDQYNQTEISVIAKNDAGVGISNVLVRFALASDSRVSNGEISHEFDYTCCESSDADDAEDGGDDGGGNTDDGSGTEIGQNGVASVIYTNIQGGNDILTAYVLDPFTSEILTDSEGNQIGVANITIVNNEACPNCDEDLNLIADGYLLPDDSGLESTDIYAFYTDSLGTPPALNSFMTFSALQADPDNQGDWLEVGSLNPENALFVTAQAGELSGDLFSNFPEDTTLVYAKTTFNTETASGLVRVIGLYEGLTDTLGIQISSSSAHSVSITPPFPSVISVQGSPTDESTVLEAVITDGMGNNVTDPYVTRWSLTNETVLGGVHLDGNESLSDGYSISTLGVANITVNSGQVPTSVAMNLEVHPYSVLETIENAEDLDALDESDIDGDGSTNDRLYEPICSAYSVPLTVASGPATSGIIGYSFLEAENIGGGLTEMPISIMLWDTWANPVVDSTSVYFTLDPENLAEIGAEAKTNNVKPGGDPDSDHWPGVAWTTVTYNSAQLHEIPEILGYTTGSFCTDSTSSYEECEELGLDWQTSQQIVVSSFANPVDYENVCVDCELSLLPLSDTQIDWACPANPSPTSDIFEVILRSQLLDFYGVPVQGSNVELIYTGSQGGPTVEAILNVCFNDTNGNGLLDGAEQPFTNPDTGEPLSQEECDFIPTLTWGQAFVLEPPSNVVLTDEEGNKYFRVTFNHNECTLTASDPEQYTCTSPTMFANLVNPNGAQSDEVSVTILSTCTD